MRCANICLLLMLTLVLSVACNTTSAKKDMKTPEGVDVTKETAYIDPDMFFEECIELYPSQVLHYSFKSTREVDFNIHYHGMEGRKYAIKKDQIKYYEGELVCDEMDFYDKDQENFCMIWTNTGDTESRLQLSYYITESPASRGSK